MDCPTQTLPSVGFFCLENGNSEMGKRFISTEIWDNPDIEKLKLEHKVLWIYLFTRCDSAGVFNLSERKITFDLGFNGDLGKGIQTLIDSGHIERLENGKLFLPMFIFFQYGTLSPACKPHKSVIDLLHKHGLEHKEIKGYPKGIYTLKEKEKEKEKERGGFLGKSPAEEIIKQRRQEALQEING